MDKFGHARERILLNNAFLRARTVADQFSSGRNNRAASSLRFSDSRSAFSPFVCTDGRADRWATNMAAFVASLQWNARPV